MGEGEESRSLSTGVFPFFAVSQDMCGIPNHGFSQRMKGEAHMVELRQDAVRSYLWKAGWSPHRNGHRQGIK